MLFFKKKPDPSQPHPGAVLGGLTRRADPGAGGHQGERVCQY